MTRTALLLLLVALVAALPHAAVRTLSLNEIEEAIRLGQTRIAGDRDRFHALYRITVGKPPVDYLDVVTPFRRVVLAAQYSAQSVDRSFGQRQALQLLSAQDGQFDVVIEFTFHPLNTFIGMPAYEVAALRGAERIAPASLDRQPRFGARVEGLPPPVPIPAGQIAGAAAQPILGGTVTARFKGDDLDVDRTVDILITERGDAVARATIDFGRLR